MTGAQYLIVFLISYWLRAKQLSTTTLMILLTTMVLLLVLGDAEVDVVTVVFGVRDVSVWWITTGPYRQHNRLDREEEIPEQRISFYLFEYWV